MGVRGGGAEVLQKCETKRKEGPLGSGIGCLVCFPSGGRVPLRSPGIREHAVKFCFVPPKDWLTWRKPLARGEIEGEDGRLRVPRPKRVTDSASGEAS